MMSHSSAPVVVLKTEANKKNNARIINIKEQ